MLAGIAGRFWEFSVKLRGFLDSGLFFDLQPARINGPLTEARAIYSRRMYWYSPVPRAAAEPLVQGLSPELES
jgi:hypothetical protein